MDFRLIAGVAGGLLTLVYMLFLADTTLSPGELEAWYMFFPNTLPPRGRKGSRWGIPVLVLAAAMILFSIWPL